MILKIDHIGIAVRDLQQQITFYKDIMGLTCTGVEEVADQKVKVAMFPVGEIRLELLQPTSPDSPIAKFLEKKGEGVHHIAYQVDNIEKQLQSFEDNKVQLIDKVPRKGAEGLNIAFLHPKSTFGVLTEICEEE
ncbi:MAG: methylmalonyl-CoA epimerase [Candidatus Zhuqueibacterota bacterium]